MICQVVCPRPRTIADADILAAAQRAIGRLGPARLTLAHVAREAGLAPATLVQRFGSKRGLLLALARTAVDDVDACFERVRRAHRSPLAALVAAATDVTRYVSSPDELANSVAFLQMDVSDPAFHALAVENSRRMLRGYQRLIEEAVRVRELAPCDTSRLARVVGAVSGGSLITWAILQQGAAERWVRADVTSVLKPYRREKRT
jgi:AcrR family transcriptional regulator